MLGGVDRAEDQQHRRRRVVLDEGVLALTGGAGVSIRRCRTSCCRQQSPVEHGGHHQPITGGVGRRDPVDLLRIGLGDEHLDLAAARQSDVERVVVADAVGDQHRRRSGEHLGGPHGHVGLHATAADRARHGAGFRHRQARPQRARCGALGRYHSCHRSAFAGGLHRSKLVEYFAHQAKGSIPASVRRFRVWADTIRACSPRRCACACRVSDHRPTCEED